MGRDRLAVYRDDARPGVAPGSRGPAGTMFAALYGELTPHQWRSPDSDRDPYFLFYHRALALGWLDDVGEVFRPAGGGTARARTGAPGLWSMHDAGLTDPRGVPGSALVAWFQVGVERVAADRPLPVQPFLRCAGDAVAQIGTLRLRAVQLLLPVQSIDAAARPASVRVPSLQTAGWFADGDPRSREPAQITVDSGQVPSVIAAAPWLREQLETLEQEVFTYYPGTPSEPGSGPGSGSGSDTPPATDPLAVTPPFDDSLWAGPPGHRVAFHGTLAEWSLDALGWLGGFLADLSACRGVSSPVLLTASRPGPDTAGAPTSL